VGAKDDGCAKGNIFDFFNEDDALALEVLDDPFVVDDGVADVERGSVDLQGKIDNFDCVRDSSAKSSGGGKQNTIHDYSLQEFGVRASLSLVQGATLRFGHRYAESVNSFRAKGNKNHLTQAVSV
jgi:hypothetical protein